MMPFFGRVVSIGMGNLPINTSLSGDSFGWHEISVLQEKKSRRKSNPHSETKYKCTFNLPLNEENTCEVIEVKDIPIVFGCR